MGEFSLRGLSVLAYANGFTLWHYRTDDAQTIDPRFFTAAADMIAAGDMILISAPNGGRLVCIVSGTDGLRAVNMA